MNIMDNFDNEHMVSYAHKTGDVAKGVATFLKPSNNERKAGIFTFAQVRSIILAIIIATVPTCIVANIMPSSIQSGLTAIIAISVAMLVLIASNVIGAIASIFEDDDSKH